MSSIKLFVVVVLVISSFDLIFTQADDVGVDGDRRSTSGRVDGQTVNQLAIDTLEDVETLTYLLLRQTYGNEHEFFKSMGDKVTTNVTYMDKWQGDKLLLNHFLLNLKNGYVDGGNSVPLACDDVETILRTLYPNESIDNAKLRKLQRLCSAATKCQKADDLYSLIETGVGDNRAPLSSYQAVARLCPLYLFQVHSTSCAKERPSTDDGKVGPSSASIWGFGLLFVTIISFSSLVGVAILPLLNKNSFDNVLNVFMGLAVGSLTGSAVFHLIPQAFELQTQSSQHDYLWKSLIIFGGIYLFFWSETVMKIVVDIRRRNKEKDTPMISMTDTNVMVDESEKRVCFVDDPAGKSIAGDPDLIQNGVKKMEPIKSFTNNNKSSVEFADMSRPRTRSNSFGAQDHHRSHSHGDLSSVATVAWMIIFGDGLHNFIDGLAIGAAFSDSILSGISISVAVVCEEFPHELGDFAILIASGMTTRQAVGYNFLSACTCYLGLIVGILMGDTTSISMYIFALAGGMFLYIALVDMMGELSAALDKVSKVSTSQTLKVLALQNIGIITGIFILFVLARYSEHINFDHLAPPSESLETAATG